MPRAREKDLVPREDPRQLWLQFCVEAAPEPDPEPTLLYAPYDSCPSCGAAISSNDPDGLCSRCGGR